jgi:hypothetical protein
MKTTTHKTAEEAVSHLKNNFAGLQIDLTDIGQHGEFIWEAKTPFARPSLATQYAGSIYFNHDSQFNKVWHVKGTKV